MYTHQRKLIWAIDPFEEDVTFRAQIIQAIQSLSERLAIPVEPTYILNLAKESELEATHLPHARHYQQAAMKAVKKNIESVRGIRFMNPKILHQPDSSFTLLVKKLAEYAGHSGAEAIIVGTHARTGLPRLLLGSFTESLLIQSEIPVITVGPQCKVRIEESLINPATQGPSPRTTPTILFSTDLTENSERMDP